MFKIKKYLCLFIIFCCSMFLYNLDVKADVYCNYTLSLSPNQPEESTYKHYDEYLGYFMYNNPGLGEGTNGTYYLNMFSQKFAKFTREKTFMPPTYIVEMPDTATFMNATVSTILDSNGNLKSTKLAFDAKFSYAMSHNVVYDFDSSASDSYAKSMFKYNIPDYKVGYSRDYCPDVLFLRFDFDAVIKDFFVSIIGGLYYDDYTYDGMASPFERYGNDEFLVAISTNLTEMKNVDNFKDYYIAKSCDLIFLDEKMDSSSPYLDEVSLITENLKSADVYDELLGWTEDELVAEAKKHEDGNGDWDVANAVLNLPYFSNKDLSLDDEFINSIVDKMSSDQESIDEYLSRLKNCLGTVTLEEYSKMFEGAYKKNDPLHLEEYKLILSKIENKEFIVSIIKAKLEKKIASEISNETVDECDNIYSSADQLKCKAGKLQSQLKKVSCDNLWDAGVELSEYDSYVKTLSENQCQSKNDLDCLKEKCEEIKNISIDEAVDIINGDTEAQQFVKKLSGDLLTDLVGMKGYKITVTESNEFCKLINSSLGKYITLALNWIRIGGSILVIFLTGYDAMKYFISSKDDDDKKFFKNFKIRLICLVILLLVPTLVDFLLSLINKNVCEELRNTVGLK